MQHIFLKVKIDFLNMSSHIEVTWLVM